MRFRTRSDSCAMNSTNRSSSPRPGVAPWTRWTSNDSIRALLSVDTTWDGCVEADGARDACLARRASFENSERRPTATARASCAIRRVKFVSSCTEN